jgi:hypothetical protein
MNNLITESLRYWEPRRIAYNAALALVVVGTVLYHHVPPSALTWQSMAELMVSAVVANVLYCSAYVADLFMQLSDFSQTWKRYRWALLAAGTILAAVIFLLHE